MSVESKYYKPSDPVSVVPLENYTYDAARLALEELILNIGGLDFVKQGMRVAVKANLVSAMKPEKAATTHPVLLAALCDMLSERGAEVVVGDSPGGLYNSAFVRHVYSVT